MRILQRFLVLEPKVAVSGTVFEIEIKGYQEEELLGYDSKDNRGPKAVAVKAFIKSKQEFDAVNELISKG